MSDTPLIEANKGALKYAIVEVIKGDEKNNTVHKGLLKGIVKEKGEKFVILVKKDGKDEVILMANTRHYRTLSVEVFDGESKIYVYFRALSEDQKLAMECVEQIVKLMEHFAHSIDKFIIDTAKYTDVPRCVGLRTTSTSTGTGASTPDYWHRTGHEYRAPRNANKYERTPEVIKRKTKKPSEELLKKIEDKMKLIDSRDYKPNFPEIEGDKKVETDDDDDLETYYQTGGINNLSGCC